MDEQVFTIGVQNTMWAVISFFGIGMLILSPLAAVIAIIENKLTKQVKVD